MSQGDRANSVRTRSRSRSGSGSGRVGAGNQTDAAAGASSSSLPTSTHAHAHHNLTTDLLHHNLTSHVPFVASAPEVNTTAGLKPNSGMQPRASYKNGDGPKYFDPYDPWIGIRTAAILGGFLMLIVVYILYKARCRLSGSVEVTKVSYYQEYKERCRERILNNIRARQSLAQVHDRTSQGGGGQAGGVTPMDLTAKWIQSQPLCSAIPDESGEVKTPNLNDRAVARLRLTDIQLQSPTRDLRIPGSKDRSAALFHPGKCNATQITADHDTAADDELSICDDGKVPIDDAANSSDLTYPNSAGHSPPLSNTHFHIPLIHHTGFKDSVQSIDENSNVPSTKLNAADTVQIEMVQLTRRESDKAEEKDNDSVDSGKSAESDSSSPEQKTSSRHRPLSRMRSQSHSSLIPSASSVSSGLEIIDPLRLLNGGPVMYKKCRSNGNIVQMKLDTHLPSWRPPKNAVTKL